MKEIIFEVLNDMAEELTVAQLKKLQEVLLKRFDRNETQPKPADNQEYLLYSTGMRVGELVKLDIAAHRIAE